MLTNQQKIAVAKLPNINDVIALLNECKTVKASLIGKDQHETVVNAVIFESEAGLIFQFLKYLDDIKQNNFHDQ